MSDVILEVTDLVVDANGSVISRLPGLQLTRGGSVALVGESGSGKSTALWAMLGQARFMGLSVSGSVTMFGVDMLSGREADVRAIRGAKAALVLQSPRSALNPTMRLGVLMDRAVRLHGASKDSSRVRMREAMGDVYLDDELLDRYPHEISGGQAQRFVIALALACNSELLFADEPTSALDVTVQAEIMSLISELRTARDLSLLMVSHDLALVSSVADEVVVMKDAQVVYQGSCESVFAGTDNSYVQELVAAVPHLDSRDVR